VAEPFKNLVNPALVRAAVAPLARAWPAFDGEGFVDRACTGLETLELAPARVALGGAVTLTLVLHSGAAKPQRLAIDYAVHHVKADGRTTPKVFKGWQLELPARGTLTLTRRHRLRPVTPRRYHAGHHGVTVQVNGRPVAETAFTLTIPKDAA
jgi:hypothetical protein